MNYRDFRETVCAAGLHDLADVTCSAARVVAGTLIVEDEESEQLIAKLRDEIAGLEKESVEEREATVEAERARGAAVELLAELKDPESGVTVQSYKERAEKAEEDERQMRYALQDAQKECAALRKRKGVVGATVRYAHDIRTLLCYIKQAPIEQLPRYRDDCAKLLAKIDEP